MLPRQRGVAAKQFPAHGQESTGGRADLILSPERTIHLRAHGPPYPALPLGAGLLRLPGPSGLLSCAIEKIREPQKCNNRIQKIRRKYQFK
jgi:hypothetical protein